MKRWLYLLLLTALITGGIAASVGRTDEDVDLSGVLAIWGSLVRDGDDIALRLTRVSAPEEMRIGAEVSAWVPVTSQDARRHRVEAVGNRLLPFVRREAIRYTFQIVDDRSINAFALPGGRIFVAKGMLDFAASDAELAVILGHEIAHVDLRHCISRYQYQAALERVGLGSTPATRAIEIGHWLINAAYNKAEEVEADAHGVGLMAAAGYDPAVALELFARVAQLHGEEQARRARTPVGEIVLAIGTLSRYFESHPPSRERMERLERLVRTVHAPARRRKASVFAYIESARRPVVAPLPRDPAQRVESRQISTAGRLSYAPVGVNCTKHRGSAVEIVGHNN